MKRKIILLLICFFSMCSLFGMGAGIQVEAISPLRFRNVNLDRAVDYSADYEFMCLGTIRSDRYPFIVGAGINTWKEDGKIRLGGAGFFDFPVIDLQMKNNWNVNFGAGVTYTFGYTGSNGFGYSLGERLFAGTGWTLYDGYLELYIQQNMENRRIVKKNAPVHFLFCFPTDIGVRWHF